MFQATRDEGLRKVEDLVQAFERSLKAWPTKKRRSAPSTSIPSSKPSAGTSITKATSPRHTRTSSTKTPSRFRAAPPRVLYFRVHIRGDLMPINAYLRAVEETFARGDATEHTYRPALKTLVESLDTGVVATNELRRSRLHRQQGRPPPRLHRSQGHRQEPRRDREGRAAHPLPRRPCQPHPHRLSRVPPLRKWRTRAGMPHRASRP